MLKKGLLSLVMVFLAALPAITPAYAQASTYTVSGRISTAGGKAVADVVLSLNGTTATSSANGVFTFTAVVTGSYTLVPLKAGCTFTPTSQTVVVTTASVGEVNFTAACIYSVSGSVTDEDGNALSGVTVNALQEAGVVASATTDSLGLFSLTGLSDGEYWITAVKSGYLFSNGAYAIQVPESLAVPAGFFVGETSATGYGVVGAIYDQWGIPMGGVTVTNELGNISVTDASGVYQFPSLTAGVHRFSASRRGFVFSPPQRYVSLPPAASGVVFIGISRPEANATLTGCIQDAAGNPLADTVVYVGQNPLAVTNEKGNYSLSGINPGIYTIQAVKQGYIFYPQKRTVSLPRDAEGQDFTALD